MPGNNASQTETRFTEWLANHPRFMGALFVTLVLLSKAGTAVAGHGSATAGP